MFSPSSIWSSEDWPSRSMVILRFGKWEREGKTDKERRYREDAGEGDKRERRHSLGDSKLADSSFLFTKKQSTSGQFIAPSAENRHFCFVLRGEMNRKATHLYAATLLPL